MTNTLNTLLPLALLVPPALVLALLLAAMACERGQHYTKGRIR